MYAELRDVSLAQIMWSVATVLNCMGTIYWDTCYTWHFNEGHVPHR